MTTVARPSSDDTDRITLEYVESEFSRILSRETSACSAESWFSSTKLVFLFCDQPRLQWVSIPRHSGRVGATRTEQLPFRFG